MRTFFFFYLLLLLPVGAFPLKQEDPEKVGIVLGKMFTAVNNINSLTYKLRNTERIKGKLLVGEQFIKFNASPRKCYVLLLKPSMGSELLYVQGKNNGNAVYNPSGFPYIKLDLDPDGPLMRKNNHYTIHEIGFVYLKDLIADFYLNHPEFFQYNETVIWQNRRCHKLTIHNTGFKTIFYTVRSGENLTRIARKRKVSEYMILEMNPEISDYDDVKTGQQIKIPNSYAKIVELYIDANHYLPVKSIIYDQKGLYEKYEYLQLVYNPLIPETEFTEQYLGKHIYLE